MDDFVVGKGELNKDELNRDALNKDELDKNELDKDMLKRDSLNNDIGKNDILKNNELILAMVRYYAGDPKRINHFLKVNAFGKIIASKEKVDSRMYNIIDVATITHDNRIKVSEEKYGSSAGKYQELEGPAIAKDMLSKLEYDEGLIERTMYLIGHHHTYDNITGLDYQILVEADFLVNIYEDGMSKEAINSVRSKIFKTDTGKKLLDSMFDIKEEK